MTIESNPSVSNPFGHFSATTQQAPVQLGISVESLSDIEAQIPAAKVTDNLVANSETLSFTQFAAQHLYNYVAGFAKEVPGTSESYVPLSSIQKWFENIQRKLSFDANFWKK